MPIDLDTFPSARQLKAIRGWLGQNQLEFGAAAGVSLSTITNFETDTVRTSTDSRIAISRYLEEVGVTIDKDGNLILPQ